MESLITLLQDNLIGSVITFVFITAVLTIAFAYARRNMGKVEDQWRSVVEPQGLTLKMVPVELNYEGYGSYSTEYPNVSGVYRGRQVVVQPAAGMEGREQGYLAFTATVGLKSAVPFVALAYKSDFPSKVQQFIPNDSKTDVTSLKKNFKIRTNDLAFIEKLGESYDIAAGMKAQKLRTARLIFDGDGLGYQGTTNTRTAKPEQALTLLDWLCDVADATDAVAS